MRGLASQVLLFVLAFTSAGSGVMILGDLLSHELDIQHFFLCLIVFVLSTCFFGMAESTFSRE